MAKPTSSMKKPTNVSRVPSAPIRSAPVAAAPSTVREVKPTADQIRQRAYCIYTQRVADGKGGDQQSDWLKAERELCDGRR